MDINNLLASFASAFDQNNRLLSLDIGTDQHWDGVLLPQQVEGSEAVSDSYRYLVDCLSPDATLELKQLLGLPARLAIRDQNGVEVVRTGVITSAEAKGSDGGFARYALTIEPPFVLLKLRSTSRVFQDLSVTDIVKQILAEHQANNPVFAKQQTLEFHLSGRYEPRSYTLQYRESDYDFIVRLLHGGEACTPDASQTEPQAEPENEQIGVPRRGSPALDKYTIDLTAQARAGKIDTILGREHEIRQMIDILMRRRQNNPILTGEPGVGKTAVVEGLALKIAQGQVPGPLAGVTLRTLDLGLLQAGASVKGEFESRLRQVIDEVKASPVAIILFIDEAHTLIGAGGAAGQNDAANLLKPALARGELRTIAATTWAEYKKYFEKDAALARRFQVVKVEEPAPSDAIQMLRGIREAMLGLAWALCSSLSLADRGYLFAPITTLERDQHPARLHLVQRLQTLAT